MPTVARSIEIIEVSSYLANDAVANGSLFGEVTDPKLPVTLFMIAKVLDKIYTEDSTYEYLQKVADYGYYLTGKFKFKAAAFIDGGNGGNVAGVTPEVSDATEIWETITVESADFANATEYDNSDLLAASEVLVFADTINQRYLIPNEEWEFTVNGIKIIIDGFDSTAYDYTFHISYKERVSLSAAESPEPINYIADGSEGVTIQFNQLIGESVKVVMRDGLGYQVVTTGTPTAKQALFNTITGEVTFVTGTPLGSGEWVYIDVE